MLEYFHGAMLEYLGWADKADDLGWTERADDIKGSLLLTLLP